MQVAAGLPRTTRAELICALTMLSNQQPEAACCAGGRRPAADHAGEMVAALAAAAALVHADGGASAAERREADGWLESAEAVQAWGLANPGMAKAWFADVRRFCLL